MDDVCKWVEDEFEIDRANSGDKLDLLGADKFGYRSVHYVIEMRPGTPAGIPPELVGMKAELQIRTIAQHAWSDVGHDLIYKAECDVPDLLESRESQPHRCGACWRWPMKALRDWFRESRPIRITRGRRRI